MEKPTPQTYDELQIAYDYFNVHLFEGKLPDCIITMQRQKSTVGYFAQDRWVNKDGQFTDEIALNPSYFFAPIEDVLRTLVHEMCHLWQWHFGKKGRGGYHNTEWSSKIESLGIMPSHTGEPGGQKIGDHMSDYSIEGGRFSVVTRKFIKTGFGLSWIDRHQEAQAAHRREIIDGKIGEIKIDGTFIVPEKIKDHIKIHKPSEQINKSNRDKYTCTACNINAWGKPGLFLICGNCNRKLKIGDENGET